MIEAGAFSYLTESQSFEVAGYNFAVSPDDTSNNHGMCVVDSNCFYAGEFVDEDGY